ncbi:hypothetical protein ACJIZ3_014741 [Penstemon smallii]|uniref:DUF4378 domain-containing protein n=1 Tax=Penstemon smallii TaxID=265156 RepID=A0ABD3RKQ1_9LAMI
MSAKILPSLTEEKRDLRRQIGCMNGIFQIFDRHHFITGRRINGHKRLLPGAQYQQDPQYATKGFMEKDREAHKEKPRISMESSRASYSSSSCSSTFSSLDSNRTAQTEKLSSRRIIESPFQIKATKERDPSTTEGKQSHDLRDVVKDSMHREARGLSIKSKACDERKGHVMKHIDSPRPLQQPISGKPKATRYEGSTRVLDKVHEGTKTSKEERLTLPRFSYDERESRETYKSAMKLKELPRLSLDSKENSMKSSPMESRLNFLGRNLHMENENSRQVFPLNQEPGSHNRSSSVIAKLMGLDAFPDIVSMDAKIPKTNSCPQEDFVSLTSTTADKSKQNQVPYSPRLFQNNPSPRLHNANSCTKPTTVSRFPIEPAPRRQQDSSPGSQKLAPKNRKAPKDTQHVSSSVFGEIEKRITQLEFKKSAKDLRALKHILEAMQKTKERLEESAEFTSQRSCYLEHSFSEQNSNLSMLKNRKSNHQIPTIKRPCPPKQLGSSIVVKKPPKVTEKNKIQSSTQVPNAEMPHLQRIQTQEPKYHIEDSAHRQKAKVLTPRNNVLKDPSRQLPPTDNIESCTTSGRSFGMVSPRLKKNLIRIEGQFHPTAKSSDSGGVKKHFIKKLVEKDSQNRKHKVKKNDLQFIEDQLSEMSSDSRYSSYLGDSASIKSESNNSLVSQIDTEAISLARSTKTKAGHKENYLITSREHIPAVELAVTMQDQPSPVSVLDATFYDEDSPSPVKKITTVFQDESPSPDEAEWHLENLDHSMDCRGSDRGYKYNQKLDNIKLVHELRTLNAQSTEIAASCNASIHETHNPDHRYITKILLTSGLLEDASFILTADQPLSSYHLINPEMFHVLEQTESIMEGANGEPISKNDWKKLNQKSHRKIVFDMVNEILIRKTTLGRLSTMGTKRMSHQGTLKEVYKEVDRLQRMQHCNHDDEDDGLIKLLTADMMYQSEDWTNYNGGVPALALDIERLIFKDLINEVVMGEVIGLDDLPNMHCRQLFTN